MMMMTTTMMMMMMMMVWIPNEDVAFGYEAFRRLRVVHPEMTNEEMVVNVECVV